MTAPYLAPCLVQLRTEFNEEDSTRDKGSDGWIGDAAHQAEHSDHNPDSHGRVLALDIDSTGPWPDGVSMTSYVNFILTTLRSQENDRLEYVIWDRHIYQRKNDWAKEAYTGTSDPHTGHAHFSARHDLYGFNDNSTWNLWEVSMPSADEIAQAVASKLAVDMRNDKSGIAIEYQHLVDDTAAAVILSLYNDIRRGPDTSDTRGQSGNNKALRQIVREEVAALLNPPPPPAYNPNA